MPPVRPGGKWRPPGADRPPPMPLGPVATLQREIARLEVVLSDLQREASAVAAAVDVPAVRDACLVLHGTMGDAQRKMQEVQRAMRAHADAETKERLQQWTRAERERAEARAEQRRLEKNEQARKKRAAKRREQAKQTKETKR